MQVKVRAFGDLAKVLGREITLDVPTGSTIGDLLAKLDKGEKLVWEAASGDYQEQRLIILLGGLNIQFLNKEKTKLNDGDTVSLLPPAGGG
jgi:molybdopterin synthase sulfur carrier subunit